MSLGQVELETGTVTGRRAISYSPAMDAARKLSGIVAASAANSALWLFLISIAFGRLGTAATVLIATSTFAVTFVLMAIVTAAGRHDQRSET